MSRLVSIVLALAVLLTACSTGGVASPVAPMADDALPGVLLGDLAVEPVEITDQLEGRESLLTSAGLWRVLLDGVPVATVQLADTVAGVDDLERRLVAQFGAVPPRSVRVGGHVVHVAAGSGRTDTLALLGSRLLVVAADQSFLRRRELVRHLVDLVAEETDTGERS